MWLNGTWVFRLAGIEYDYYAHYDEPILEDRHMGSASRQLPLRVPSLDAAAAARRPNPPCL